LEGCRTARAEEVPLGLATGAWAMRVLGPDGGLYRPAYTFLVLERLREALRRRDVYAPGQPALGRSSCPAVGREGMAGRPGRRRGQPRNVTWTRTGSSPCSAPISTPPTALSPADLSTTTHVRRLSPLEHDHINFLGRYQVSSTDLADGQLRPLRDPTASDT